MADYDPGVPNAHIDHIPPTLTPRQVADATAYVTRRRPHDSDLILQALGIAS